MSVIIHRMSYQDLIDKTEIQFNDDLHILSDYLTKNVRNTLLANPSLSDYSEPAINLVIYNNNIVGRNMFMPSMIKTPDKRIHVQSGGSYEISEEHRGQGLGTIAFKESIFNNKYGAYIGQLYSSGAIAIIRKLGLNVFEVPAYYKLCNSRSIFESKGLHGSLLKVCTFLANNVINTLNVKNAARLRKLKKKYKIVPKTTIPRWVESMILHDGHDYMEVHDCKWLQWCLDHKFTCHPRDKQSFFAVYDYNKTPKGFFMIKERFEKEQGAYKNLTRGFIVEWGSADETELTEVDLNLMACDSFGDDVDNITTILSDESNDKALKGIGFIKHGYYQMSIKIDSYPDENIINQKKWRIRYGGCNTIVY